MSERNTGYQFVSTDTEAVESLLISIYEKITGVSVKPASPEKLFIQFVAAVVIQERGLNNYTGNQNIPSRAEGENLDALAELLAGAEAEPVLPLAAVSQPASRQRASAAQSSSETNRFWIMADSSFYQCPARRRGSILGLTSSILFSPAVVNRRSRDEFQLRLTFKAEAVIIGTERESNKNPTDIKPRSIV